MTTVTDDFNRANETPLAGNWSTGTGETGFNLVSNVASAPDDTNDRCSVYTAASFGNDQSSKGNLTTAGATAASQGIGLVVRHAAAARTYYRFVITHSSAPQVEIDRFVAGAGSSLVQFNQTFTDGDTFEMVVTGPAAAARIEIFRNGASIQVFTDNSSLASGNPGISYSTSSTSGTVDNWVGTDQFGGGLIDTFQAIPFMPSGPLHA